MKIQFTIPGLPPGPNGSHGNWRAHAAKRAGWRRIAKLASVSSRPLKPFSKCKLRLTRHASARMDFDNRVLSFKPIVDGLKDAGIILDDNDDVIISREYATERAKPGKGFLTIEIWDLSNASKVDLSGDAS